MSILSILVTFFFRLPDIVRLAFEYIELLKFDEEAELSSCGYYRLYVLFVFVLLLFILDSLEPVFDLCLNMVSLVPEGYMLPMPRREELVLAAPCI